MRAESFPLVALIVLSLSAVVAPAIAHSQTSGSLIEPDRYRGLTADRRAHAVGDMLTVVVVETAHASVSANTDGSHDLELSAQARTPRGTYPYGFGLSGADQGEGLTSRAGTLQAQLAVRVIRVESDGLFQVRGEQSVTINGEQQHIALSGLVREEDILASNLIPSNRIGDAQIEFTGQGDVSEAQRHGAIYRFMKWLRLL